MPKQQISVKRDMRPRLVKLTANCTLAASPASPAKTLKMQRPQLLRIALRGVSSSTLTELQQRQMTHLLRGLPTSFLRLVVEKEFLR